MTYNEALQLINQYIVTNGNNEITAAVLNPVLEAMIEASEDTTGLLQNLETEANENLVAAINELKAMIPEGATGTPVNFHFGEANPNTTPPASFKPGDNYWQTVGGNPVQLWIYNGFSWVEFGSGGGGSFPEAPVDGKAYGRKDEDWTEVTNTPMKYAEVHYTELGANSMEEVTEELANDWIEANVAPENRLGFVLDVLDYNFEVTALWSDISVIDQQSFENSLVLSGDFNISDFRIDGNNIKCTVTGTDIYFQISLIVMRVDKLGNGIISINLGNNQLTEFTPTLPESLTFLDINNNELTEFTQTLPESLTQLYLFNNHLSEFTPTLPESLTSLNLSNNQLTEFTQTLPESLKELNLFNNQLDELSINHILESYDAMPSIDYTYIISLNGGTNAAPTGAGLAAYNSLISKGAYVDVNS